MVPAMLNTKEITLRPDSKGRIALGDLAKGVSSYRVHKDQEGNIVLEPYVEIAMALLKTKS